jgi:hypothetical protein
MSFEVLPVGIPAKIFNGAANVPINNFIQFCINYSRFRNTLMEESLHYNIEAHTSWSMATRLVHLAIAKEKEI